jgi:hypothetical protein
VGWQGVVLVLLLSSGQDGLKKLYKSLTKQGCCMMIVYVGVFHPCIGSAMPERG